jgi:hypothetical protein
MDNKTSTKRIIKRERLWIAVTDRLSIHKLATK